MDGEESYDYDDEINEISVRYETIEDFLNSKPLSSVDVDLATNADEIELVFNKPIFDMAFIITHSSVIPRITELQKFFQSKHGFTTHCIFLPELAKLKYCIKDLKLHEVTYAIVAYENSLKKNSLDIYILYPNIEVQKNMTLMEIDKLVTEDAENITEQIKTLKSNPKRNPHPVKENGEELYNMNDQYRYYFSLLADNRMLDLGELKSIMDYLLIRKSQMEKLLCINKNYLEERPLEACRQEHLKYYLYEPLSNSNTKSFIDKDVYNQSSSFTVPSEKIPIPPQIPRNEKIPLPPQIPRSERIPLPPQIPRITIAPIVSKIVSINRPPIQPVNVVSTNKSPSKPIENRTVCRARTVLNSFQTNLTRISNVVTTKAQSKHLSHNIIRETNTCEKHTSRKDNSCRVSYERSEYCLSQTNIISSDYNNDDVISLSSGSNSPPMLYDLMDVSPASPLNSPIKHEKGKRKSNDMNAESEKSLPPKLHIMDPSVFEPVASSSSIKNTPENLVNLFRLILSMAPLALPHDNAIINILTNCCNELQAGILVPSLKIVKIDYDCCKTNGVNEIFESIFGIYDDCKKNVERSSDLEYIWNKFFPDHISNFDLLIAFYRFVKLLILYKLFNTPINCLNKISGVLEKINVIVNFDFNLPVLFEQKHLNCFPDTFHFYYQESDLLHKTYFTLPTETILQPPDSVKGLDSNINQKKIEFMIGPLLNYFVNSVNSIHQQMNLAQIHKIYNAIRTLRFCFRKILPTTPTRSIFHNPRVFDSCPEKQSTYCKEITDELKLLLEEMKFYQCVLFTELHYDFVNCLLDFSFTIEGIMDSSTESFKPTSSRDSLIVLDSVQFIHSFSTFQFTTYRYHPDTEIQFLKNALRDNWTLTLYHAFKGTPTERNANRIIKEINNLLPVLWGLRTFDEAVTEAVTLYYSDWTKIAQNDQSGWYGRFCQKKFDGIVWLNQYHLPYTKAIEELQKYENMLKNEFLCA